MCKVFLLFNCDLKLYFKVDNTKLGGGIWVERSEATLFNYNKRKEIVLKTDETWVEV